MTDDELTQRLAETLRAEASTVTSPPDAWERFRASAPVVPLRPSRPERRLWLAAPVGALGIAAAIALVVLVVQGGGSTNVKASSSASSPFVAAGPQRAPSVGAATGAGSAANGAAGPAAAAAPAPSSASASPAFGLAAGPAGGPVPAGFQPASVTFVSPTEGWVLGTAPSATPPCTSIVRTTDGGRTWVGIPAPVDTLSPGGGAAGVSSLRFATPMDGWAYGPDLWATHDGGATWHRMTLAAGGQVSALEASGGKVWAAVFDDTSARVRVYGSSVGSDGWAASPVTVPIGAGPVPSTQIVLQGSAGWLIEVDRTVVGGARLVDGQWSSWTPPCATVVGPADLAASSPSELAAACDVGLWGGSSPPAEKLYVSHNGGASFAEAAGTVPAGGSTVDGVATPARGTAVVAVAGSLYLSSDGGATWTAVTQPQQSDARDLGFTTPDQGIVVESGAQARPVLLMTHDGGHTWLPVSF